MAVLIVMFLVTIIAHDVTPDLECWGCQAFENKDGTHPCNDPNNFKLKKCEENETLCIDIVDKEYKYKMNDCMTEKDFNHMKSYVEDNELNIILEKCDTTKCNTKKWKDHFPVIDHLECWECKASENKNGTHPCNDQKNFQLKKCDEDEKLCFDLVDIDSKFLFKDCITEERWNKLKSFVKEKKMNVILEKCDTKECNSKKWKDYNM